MSHHRHHHLQHPQIVRFYETIRTADHLYLVLEYVENGSLAGILKQYGKFPEPILIVYMRQVTETESYKLQVAKL